MGALVKNAEQRLGRKLTDKEKETIRKNAGSVAVRKSIHKKGATYGGKNTEALQKKDASNLREAARRDAEQMLKNAREEGANLKDVKKAIKKLYKFNTERGVY